MEIDQRDLMNIPSWVNQAIFYQIFPDRFSRGASYRNFVNYQPWGSKPTLHGFQGGDLEGIRQKLNYLTDSGFNAIYLNPIFESPSTHRYNTTNYFRIDPKLGNTEDFKRLLSDAHSMGVKIILDGVFNHCGRGFFAFNDLLENQQDSPYANWYHVKQFPVDAYSPGDAEDYLGWWKFKSLPKFNTDTLGVRNYLFEVVKYWTGLGIDGWRLDVPNEIDDDQFWSDFRKIVKSSNPDAYLVGEIWDINPKWVGEHTFDGLMNYPLRTAIIDLVNSVSTPKGFVEKIEFILCAYPAKNLSAMFSLLGSHDTERVFTLLKKNVAKLKLAYFLLFSFPGVPSIYYGDEIGLEGAKDPDCRRAFNWDEKKWNEEIRNWIKQLITLRKQNLELQDGLVLKIESVDELIHIIRKNETGLLDIWANPSSGSKKIFLGNDAKNSKLIDLLNGKQYYPNNNIFELDILSYSGVMLVSQK